jgi:hypothetical protein
MGRNCLVSRNIGVILGDGPRETRSGDDRGRRVTGGQGRVRMVGIGITSSSVGRPSLTLTTFGGETSIANSQRYKPQSISSLPDQRLICILTLQMSLIGRRFYSTARQIVPPKIATPNVTSLPPPLSSIILLGIHQILTIAGRRRSQITALSSMDNGDVRTDP